MNVIPPKQNVEIELFYMLADESCELFLLIRAHAVFPIRFPCLWSERSMPGLSPLSFLNAMMIVPPTCCLSGNRWKAWLWSDSK